MDQIFKFEQEAGVDRLIVMFVNQDVSEQVDAPAFLAEIGRDAAAREFHGWKIISVGSLPLRQSGTAGNVLFQSGGQYSTQLAVMVVYARDLADKGAV